MVPNFQRLAQSLVFLGFVFAVYRCDFLSNEDEKHVLVLETEVQMSQYDSIWVEIWNPEAQLPSSRQKFQGLDSGQKTLEILLPNGLQDTYSVKIYGYMGEELILARGLDVEGIFAGDAHDIVQKPSETSGDSTNSDTTVGVDTPGKDTTGTNISLPTLPAARLDGFFPESGQLSEPFKPDAYEHDLELHADSSRVIVNLEFESKLFLTTNLGKLEGNTWKVDSLPMLSSLAQLIVSNGKDSMTYAIRFHRPYSQEAGLAFLRLDGEDVSPAEFAKDMIVSRTAASVHQVRITAKPKHDSATINFGIGIARRKLRELDTTLALKYGSNPLRFDVVAQDSTVHSSFQINLSRDYRKEARLASLVSVQTSFSPEFDSDSLSYHAEVPNGMTEFIVSLAALDSSSSVKTIGGKLGSHLLQDTLALSVGANTFRFQVTAHDPDIKLIYELHVTRLPSLEMGLSKLQFSKGLLNPEFSGSVYQYSLALSHADSVVEVLASPSHAKASLVGYFLDGQRQASTFKVPVGTTQLSFFVKPEAGTDSARFQVDITRAGNSNSKLRSLFVSQGTLDPNFHTLSKEYQLRLADEVQSLYLVPEADDRNATLFVNSEHTLSGTNSKTISLTSDTTEIRIRVLAQNESDSTIYTVKAIRLPSNDASLKSIVLNPSLTLTPTFSPTVLAFAANVPYSQAKLQIGAISNHGQASVLIDFKSAGNNGSLVDVPLDVGKNLVDIVVLAEDGKTEKTYTFQITRAANANASLARLAITPGTMAPAFGAATDYTVSLPNASTSAYIDAEPVSTARAYIGQVELKKELGPREVSPLDVGDNSVTVRVVAQDGTTSQDYKVNLYRLEGIAALKSVTISTCPGCVVVPEYNSHSSVVYIYNVADQDSLTFNIASVSEKAKIEFIGKRYVHQVNTRIPIPSDITNYKVKVIAEDSTIRDSLNVRINNYIPPVDTLVAVYAFSDFAIGLSKKSRELYLSGRSDSSQLAVPYTSQIVAWARLSDNENVLKAAPGKDHMAVLYANGVLSTTGANLHGQLGHGNNEQTVGLRDVMGLGTLTDVASGGNHVLALDNTGKVHSWGANEKQQLGRTGAPFSPAQVSLPAVANAVEAGFGFSLAKTQAGALYGWGDNASGQLGDSAFTSYSVRKVDVQGKVVSKLASGWHHVLAQTLDGSLYSWGRAHEGQLGRPGESPIPNLVSIPGTPIAFCGGKSHSAVISDNGKAYIWGDNRDGQLGLADKKVYTSPTLSPDINSAHAVACGDDFTIFSVNDSKTISVGRNEYRQISPQPAAMLTSPTMADVLRENAVSEGGGGTTLHILR